jgi:PIN domain nuclease of toxin-antitoxin system
LGPGTTVAGRRRGGRHPALRASGGAWIVRSLPAVHNDPFDRLLAAQAICERARVVSADATFDRYDVERVW